MRKRRVLASLLTATCATLMVGGLLYSPARAATASGPSAGPVFGVSFGGQPMTQQQLDDGFSHAAALGATWIRAELNWANSEPSPGVHKWYAFDAIVAAAYAHHLKVLALIMYTPAWARAAGCYAATCGPADPAEFAAFAGAAAARYGSAIGAWEIWNEPNVSSFWWPTPNAHSYSTLLQLSRSAIKAVQPSAFVLSGGLAPAASNGRDIGQRQFLDLVCLDGGLQGVNAVGVHPYSYPVPPAYPAEWNAWYDMAASPASMERILASCGHPGLPLWATEYGAPTQGPGREATPSNFQQLLSVHPDHVSEQMQSELLVDAIGLARKTAGIGALFLFTDQDSGTATTTNQLSFGLRRTDGSFKPAWSNVQQSLTAQP